MNHDVIAGRFTAPILDIIKSQNITKADVENLRLDIFQHGIQSEEQALALITLEKQTNNGCDEWAEYYVTTIADYILCHCAPVGGVSEESAFWLKRVLTSNGLVRTPNEFHLLKSILERAVPASPSFCALVLDQLRQVMMDFQEEGGTCSSSQDLVADFPDLPGSIDVLDRLNQSDLFG